MSRIRSCEVKLGDSYLLGNEKKTNEAEDEIVLNAKKQADSIIAAANDRSAKIIEEAQLKAQEILEQTRQDGFQDGYKAGYDEGYNQIHSDLTEQINNVGIITSSTFDIKKEIIQSSEQEILQLTIAIAEKLVRQHLEISPDIILNIVKAAINELSDREEVKLIVNPALTNNLYQFSENLKHTIQGLKSIKIVEDKTISPDGLIVESQDTRIDARLVTQISEITKQILSEALKNPVLKEIPKEIEVRIEEPPARKRKGK